jgi:hypothetical protein
MSKDTPVSTTESLDEVLRDAFVGLWTRDIDGNLVEINDSFDVLKNALHTDLTALIQQEVLRGRVSEISDVREFTNSLPETKMEFSHLHGYINKRQDELNTLLGGER